MSHRPFGAPSGNSSGPKRSLVLAGGGMRVAYQAGALRAILDSGITFEHADGASGGTINLAMWLSGLSPQEMCDRWRTLDVRRFASVMPLRDYLAPAGVKGLGSARGIVNDVFPHLGIDMSKINAAEGLTGTFNLCDFTTKTAVVVPNDRMDMDLLVAGISLPMFMPPVVKGGASYLDAVWIRDANPMQAVARGADEIWLIWCIGNTPEYRAGAFHEYVHMIEISANAALFQDLERIREINDAVGRGERPLGRTSPITVYVVKPEYPLPLDPELFAGRITTATLIDMGYRDASRALSERKPAPLTPEATLMREPGVGLAFSEVMRGPFRLGEQNPDAGSRAGSKMTLSASIEIVDLARFLVDPDHTGSITGHVDVPGLGSSLPSKIGTFNLFSAESGEKRMIYELGFEHGGQDYYLAGHKELRPGAVLHSWSDTTTLYVKLHRGKDAEGSVVGAGTLTLSPAALARMLGTITVRNARSPAERVQALARFGAFFSNELYRNYLGHSPAGAE